METWEVNIKGLRDTQGIMQSIAILTALSVAKKRWTDEDTQEYGTKFRDMILSHKDE